MQPYFLPYIGYFSLMKHAEKFIIFDTVQYIRHGWIERNRILKPVEGWQYIRVPLQTHSQTTPIKDILIDNSVPWKKKILSQIDTYKKNAPYFLKVRNLMTTILNLDYITIVDLNVYTLREISNYIGFKTPFEIFSQMKIEIEPVHEADEWALNICKALGNVTEYHNLPGGVRFFDTTKYDKAGIQIDFQQIELQEYNQQRPAFESGLSIIDVMMFNSPETINNMLDNYKLV